MTRFDHLAGDTSLCSDFLLFSFVCKCLVSFIEIKFLQLLTWTKSWIVSFYLLYSNQQKTAFCQSGVYNYIALTGKLIEISLIFFRAYSPYLLSDWTAFSILLSSYDHLKVTFQLIGLQTLPIFYLLYCKHLELLQKLTYRRRIKLINCSKTCVLILILWYNK